METSDTQDAIDAGMQLASKQFETNGTHFMLVPDNFQIEKIPHQETPVRIKEHVKHATAESFSLYYHAWANADTVVFLNNESNTFTAIFDYHNTNTANWCDHKSSFTLQNTPEWTNWKDNNSKRMSQEQFGQFIEDNQEEIIEPTGAEMLEIATSLQATTNVKFSKAIRLDNGQTSIEYAEDINGTAGAKGQLKIPQIFTIGLKLFNGGDGYKIEARLKYRIESGNLKMWYELIRPHKVVDANIADTKAFILGGMTVGKLLEAIR